MNINATLLGQTLAFVIFVAICWKYVWPPIIAIMEEREKRIADGLEAAKKADDSLEEAQLAFDLSKAARINNEGNLFSAREALNALIGREIFSIDVINEISKTRSKR